MSLKVFRLGKDNWARTRPTKEGMVFLGLTVFVGFAAMNTGNNLLYLTFGMMLSFVAASGVLSMVNLLGIDIKPNLPNDVFALSPNYIRFSLTNLKPLIPSYALTVDLNGSKGFLSYLPSRSTKDVSVSYIFKRRGWNLIPEVHVYTKFPFGFFKKWIRFELDDEEVLVYPKVRRVAVDPEQFRISAGESAVERLGHGAEIRSLRDYMPGDNPKLIHWKSSAKMDKVILREFEDEESERIYLEFNPGKNTNSLEGEISRVASVFLELLKTSAEVVFVAPTETFSTSSGSRSPKPVLTYLALYDNPKA